MLVFLRAVFSLVLLCFISYLQAQTTAIPNPVMLYQLEYGNDHLYKGKRYDTYGTINSGHPSFLEMGMVEGSSVIFDNILYQDKLLIYDVVIDELVIRHPELGKNIRLPKQLVSSFTIDSHQFVHIRDMSLNLTPGYYHELYNNNDLICYARWSKEIKANAQGPQLRREIVETVRFYVKNSDSDVFTVIGSQSALLNLFKDRKRELRRLINNNGLSFKRYPRETMTLVLNHIYQ